MEQKTDFKIELTRFNMWKTNFRADIVCHMQGLTADIMFS